MTTRNPVNLTGLTPVRGQGTVGRSPDPTLEVTVSTERLPADAPVPIINEIAHLMARDAETRPRPTPEELAAEDRAAAEYLPGLPEDDIA